MKRQYYINEITDAFKVHPVVALLGPRQSGKTTLAREYAKKYFEGTQVHYFDLEDPTDLILLDEPKQLLSNLDGLIIIDEIQRKPDFFPLLRVIVDEQNSNKKFLILGSASPNLIKQSSETLAGRIEYIEITPFNFIEANGDIYDLWLRGGYPKSYLAETIEDSFRWRKNYIRTFLERDIVDFGIKLSYPEMYRFWMMLSHYHGNICNMSELGKSLGLTHTTIRRYIDILCCTYIARTLQPWHANISKRQVKMPKFYIRDSGILHNLFEINSKDSLVCSPKVGASFEGFAIEEIIRALKVRSENCYFWSTHNGAEIDLLIMTPNRRIGFEFKYTDTPKPTRSVYIAIEELGLDEVVIIYPGSKKYKIDAKIEICGLNTYLKSIFS